MKLNIGCGDKKIEGYTSVDVDPAAHPDIVAPATKIPLADASVDEIIAIHVLEHLVPWEAEEAVAEWFRLLKPGGAIALEMPDFMKSCRNIAEGLAGRTHPDQLGMWGCFGDPRTKNPLMLHRWGWWFDSLQPVMERAGFRDCVEKPTVFHRVGRDRRDFRLEAMKP